jgi:phosphate:Na+ symporter
MVRMQHLVAEMIDDTLEALHHENRSAALRVIEKERRLNTLEIDSRASHIKRLKDGSCHSLAGIHFLDILSNLERIGDHLNNVADVVLSS